MSDKTNKLTIFLIKSDFTDFGDIVRPGCISQEIEGLGTFYCLSSHPGPPDWLKDFFGNSLDVKFNIIASSARGLLLIKPEGDEAIVAVTFGHGRYLLNEGVIEDRFGLRIVLNSVDRDNLRSIDKTSLGSVAKQSREQISRAGRMDTFGIDIEQDLLGSVTGRSSDPRFGRTITGKDSLSVSVKVDMSEISELAQLCLERYRAENYKAAGFDWIDQIKDLRDPTRIAALDAKLVERLGAGQLDKIWMAPPEIVDWVDVKGFRYLRPKRSELTSDLDVGEFLEALDGAVPSITLLKEKFVFLISDKTDSDSAHWSAYRCIYAELEDAGMIYILHNGKWYEVAKDFTDRVVQYFEDTPESVLALPDYDHKDEGAYNKFLPTVIENSHCMDCDIIMHGGGHSSIEFCDLLTAEKHLVFVKRYSGSQQLSHLFAQGVVSAELFVRDAEFREKLNDKLPGEHKLANPGDRPDPHDYEVVFAIISKSKNPLDIPFFSKVSLRAARERLSAYGYRVTKKKVSRQELAAV